MCIVFFFELYRGHRDLHVLTHSFPTRRSSDLELADDPPNAGDARIVLFGPHRLPRDLGVLPHRAQFHDVEALIIQPHPTLAIERRPAALELTAIATSTITGSAITNRTRLAAMSNSRLNRLDSTRPEENTFEKLQHEGLKL